MANLFPTPFNTDLPEDWEQGQIVSPNGTEVGLSKQHGYNYLMQSVNALASGLNGVNTNSLLTSLGVIPVANGGTGKTTAKEAFAVLGADYGFPNAKGGYYNVDLNTFTTNGFYFTSGQKTDTNVYHLPEEVFSQIRTYYEFNLIVFGVDTRKTQIAAFPYSAAPTLYNRVWVRTGAGASFDEFVWSNWVEFTTNPTVVNNQLIMMEAMATQYEENLENRINDQEVQATTYEAILELGGNL